MQITVLQVLQSRLLEILSTARNGAAQLVALKRPEKEALPEVAPAEAEPYVDEGMPAQWHSRANMKCRETMT